MRLTKTIRNSKIDALLPSRNSGTIEIYTGVPTTLVTDAITTQVLLGTINLPSVSGVDFEGIFTSNPITSVASIAGGIATWYRLKDSGGTPIQDGSISDNTGNGDLMLDNISITVGGIISISNWSEVEGATDVVVVANSVFEGFGENVTGGAGQPTINVTNLNDSGAGSLREALNGSNREIKFTVSGTINLLSRIFIGTGKSNISILGFTSPAGITISGHEFVLEGNATDSLGNHPNNIIIQGIKSKDSGLTNDGFRAWRNAHDIVFDHLSVENSGDGSIDITEGAHDITISWCLLMDSASGSTLHSYHAHRVSHINNFYWSSHRRNPLIDDTPRFNSSGTDALTETWADIRNNVLWDYGWGMSLDGTICTANIVNNLFTDGDINANSSFAMNRADKGYLAGNVATMDITTGSQWLTNVAITSTNSNSKGAQNAAPTIVEPATNDKQGRLDRWTKVVAEAGQGGIYIDSVREGTARAGQGGRFDGGGTAITIPAISVFDLSWNDG